MFFDRDTASLATQFYGGAPQPIGSGDAASVLLLSAVPTALTVPGSIGRVAIVAHSDDTFSAWMAVDLSPVTWIPITSGIIWNDDDSEWIRLTFSSGTLDKTTLPDQ